MADVKISGLPASTLPLAGTEVLPIVQSGVTKKVASDDLTVKNVRSNATTGVLQVAGPAAAATRVMTTPDANFTVARTDAGQTFTGVNTFTSPKIITDISDTNGNELIKVTATASAVNEITVANAATGNNPVLSATGSDTNIGITLTPKGTGNTVLTSGNLAVANGNGIDFSATSGTGTSELLSDYEEGTWNGELRGITTSATTPVIATGYYTKIGRQVNVQIYFVNVDTTGASGQMTVNGFPFTSANVTSFPTGAVLSSNLSGAGFTVMLGGNSTQVEFATSGNPWSFPNIVPNAGQFLTFSLTYYTA
jgi:hypothetical protein